MTVLLRLILVYADNITFFELKKVDTSHTPQERIRKRDVGIKI
ncbi:hypothetical protein SAMN04487890_11429 [Mucilaginibacter polytrichastri]|nr:hypothetical protein SAMN04487890_11429 [Mucilaginibacter polytrichastri]